MIGLIAAGLAGGSPSPADDVAARRVVVRAVEAFEQGQGAWGVRRGSRGGVCLYDRVLVEDDGPGIGGDAKWMVTDRAPTTQIAGDTRIRKVLHVERLGAREARLCVPAGVAVEVNGRAIEVPADEPFPRVSVRLLKEGDNQVVLSCPPGVRRRIKIALPEDILRNAPDRKGRPPRSFRSLDGGKTWQRVRGEYMVRLHLIQYVARGHFVSAVMDLGEGGDTPRPLLTPVSIESASVRADAVTPDGTAVELAVRSGPSPVYEADLWSGWRQPGATVPKGHRYLQWKAVLSSADPLKTPVLRSVAVEAKVRRQSPPSWASRLKTVAFHNERVRYTSLPFEYEDPLHPRMVALRRKYKLDAVVAGAATETERLVRLRDWVAHQWKYYPPAESYPAWDADEILRRKVGFCVQYAIVFMQSAIALGHQARFVFGYNPESFDSGGHEVCEVWSNEHRKWILYDVNDNWHFIDPRTHVPMSMLEVHDLIAKTYYGTRPATIENGPRKRMPSDAIAICYGTGMTPGTPPKGHEAHFANGRYTVPIRWLRLAYMPRNNFYAKPYPQPKTQGCHWDFSEYWCWEDATTPKRWLYRNFTARRNDLNWTINQVCFDATIGDRPGSLAIQMGTVTPYFDAFLVKADRQAWKESPRAFVWKLHAGRNRLDMRTRNKAGVLGPVSFLEVEH
jgi:transglutaminase-like putative cysteine protease